jgi:alginate O-acetyltransferase complex protein AlgJ
MSKKRELLSGYAFSIMLLGVGIMALCHLPQTLARLERPLMDDVVQGKWTPQFEKSFREALPVNTASRDLWGRIEYALFHQGRKGVVVGARGWLFTDEEFLCPADYRQKLTDNLLYIYKTKQALEEKDVRVLITLVPEKARVFPGYLGANALSPCRLNLYASIRTSLIKKGVTVTDLLSAMQNSPFREKLYLKTDTHWSPAGARLAAQITAQLARGLFRDIKLPLNHFSSQEGGTKAVSGDLTSYIPGVAFPADQVISYATGISVAASSISQSLFDDPAPAVTLVGTSYSANPNWNFEGFLKEYLKTDVLNMADQGLGPFVVMDKYLQTEAWKKMPPKLVIWEMPERYFFMPHDVVK